MLKPGGTLAISTWMIEGWVPDVRDAVKTLPGQPNWPDSSSEMVAMWARGPWHEPAFVHHKLEAAGFVNCSHTVVTKNIKMRSPRHFVHVFRAFLVGVAGDYWTVKQQKALTPLVHEAVERFLEGKYGVNNEINVERTAIFTSGRKA
jgi:hypothetical protein